MVLPKRFYLRIPIKIAADAIVPIAGIAPTISPYGSNRRGFMTLPISPSMLGVDCNIVLSTKPENCPPV